MRATVQHRTDRQTFLRDIGFLVGLPFVASIALLFWVAPWAPRYEVPADTDIFAVATGTWDWTTSPADSFCVARRHTVAFSDDRRIMTITQNEPWTDSAGVAHQVAVYDLSEHSRRHVRGQIRGETRLTDAGTPVVWDLVLTSAETYKWHRADWSWSFGYTATVRRCPAGTPAAVAARNSTGD